MHQTHKLLSGKIPGSKCAYYPEKGHAWMVNDINTHIQLVKYWFLNDEFPTQLKLYLKCEIKNRLQSSFY